MKNLFAAILLVGVLVPFGTIYAAQNPQNLPPPAVFFSADPERVFLSEATVFSWNALYATSCRASGGWSGAKAIVGSEFVRPDETDDYRLSCRGPGGSVTEEIEITVRIKSKQPALLFTAKPSTVEPGRTSRLEWDSPNADSCLASGGAARGWSGVKRSSGTLTIRPADTARYELACANEFGTTTERLTIAVNSPPPPPAVFLPLEAHCGVYPPAALPNQPVNFAANASGGNPPYTYRWSGETDRVGIVQTFSFSKLGTKNMVLTIRDSTDNVATTSCAVVVTLNPPPLFQTPEPPQSKIMKTAGGRTEQIQPGRGGKEREANPVLATFQSNFKPPLAAVGTVFVGFAKLLGWLLLIVFNILLFGVLGYLLYQIRKEYLAQRQPSLFQSDLSY